MKIRNVHCFSRYYLQDLFLKTKLVERKGAKINDVFRLSPNHVLSYNSGNNYYIIFLRIFKFCKCHQIDFKENYKR